MKNSPTEYITSTLPTTQLVKMSIDPKFVELTADVLKISYKYIIVAT